MLPSSLVTVLHSYTVTYRLKVTDCKLQSSNLEVELCCSPPLEAPALLLSSSFVAVLQLCCSPPALLQSSNFVAVLQLCRSPPALLRSSNFVPTRMRSRLSVYYEIWTPCSRHCQGCSPSRTRRARHCRDCSAPGLHLGPASGLDLRSPRLSPLASRLSPLASRLSPRLSPRLPPCDGWYPRRGGSQSVDSGMWTRAPG